ncbi:MAG: metalloprotease TldD [Succinivibrio sp.]|nr:metalloprotease TldD [Succinivibrio sp.]
MDKASALLWQGSDLDEQICAQAISQLNARNIDFGDLFFSRHVSESFSLEEGIVKGGSFDINQGVGVRAVIGGKTGFAYSDVLDKNSLMAAVSAARSISSGQRADKVNVTPQYQPFNPLYIDADPIASTPREHKIAALETLDRLTRKQDQRVIQVMASLNCSNQVRMVFTTDGRLTCDYKPISQLVLSIVMEQNGRRERGFAAAGGAFLLDEILTDKKLEELALEAVRVGQVNLEAQPAPAGTMTVVLSNGWPGVLIHEAVGHGLEGDFNRTGSSAFTGLIGQKVASDACTIIDDGTLPDRRGSLTFDDEGTQTKHNVLIEKGILKGYMQDRLNAALMQHPLTGNGRRENYNCLPMPRMTNTFMLPGQYAPEEIISSVKQGIYAVNFSGGQVDITSGKFVFSTSEAYLIEQGKVTTPIKGATLIGNGPETMKQVSMVGNDLDFDHGIGFCGKAGQAVPVGIGQPTLKLDAITVGGTNA